MTRFLLSMILVCSMGSARAADSDPMEYSLKQYGFLLGVAVFGGFVSWIAKVRRGEAAAWNMLQLIGELSTSAFAGLICFWLCKWASAPELLTISLVAISGHMGTRAIVVFEQWAAQRWGVSLPMDTIDGQPK